MDKRIQELQGQLSNQNAREIVLQERLTALETQKEADFKNLQTCIVLHTDRLAQLEEAVQLLQTDSKMTECLKGILEHIKKPTCKTCNGTKMKGQGSYIPCPDCAKKCTCPQLACPVHTYTDCAKSGLWAGTPKHLGEAMGESPKTSCAHDWKPLDRMCAIDKDICGKCHLIRHIPKPADPQSERTQNFEEIMNDVVAHSHDGIKGLYVYVSDVSKILTESKLFNG